MVVVRVKCKGPITESGIQHNLGKQPFPLPAGGLVLLPALGVHCICKKTYCDIIRYKMKICNFITSVAKYTEYRHYQNAAELIDMAKACILTFNANSAANLGLGVSAPCVWHGTINFLHS